MDKTSIELAILNEDIDQSNESHQVNEVIKMKVPRYKAWKGSVRQITYIDSIQVIYFLCLKARTHSIALV